MELKVPKWVPVSESERTLYRRFYGSMDVTLPSPDNRMGMIKKDDGLFLEVCGLPKIHIVSRCGKDIEKIDAAASEFVFRCIEKSIQEKDRESEAILQRQLEVLRLFEVQHDAGRQLPESSGPDELP